ncbi:MAG: Fe-S-containing hydro-lyase [Acholeplasmataceae bacterium]
MIRCLRSPLTKEDRRLLKAGDTVYLTGTILTGRDQAHRRLVEALDQGLELPIEIDGQVIYYTGPTPAPEGRVIGSCGPTSSYRMDQYSPKLMEKGLRVMIGKGDRSKAFIEEMIRNEAVYLQAVGGAGALLAERVKRMEVLCYADLGPEAIYRLEVEDFPAIVTYDMYGGNLIEEGVSRFSKEPLFGNDR